MNKPKKPDPAPKPAPKPKEGGKTIPMTERIDRAHPGVGKGPKPTTPKPDPKR